MRRLSCTRCFCTCFCEGPLWASPCPSAQVHVHPQRKASAHPCGNTDFRQGLLQLLVSKQLQRGTSFLPNVENLASKHAFGIAACALPFEKLSSRITALGDKKGSLSPLSAPLLVSFDTRTRFHVLTRARLGEGYIVKRGRKRQKDSFSSLRGDEHSKWVPIFSTCARSVMGRNF